MPIMPIINFAVTNKSYHSNPMLSFKSTDKKNDSVQSLLKYQLKSLSDEFVKNIEKCEELEFDTDYGIDSETMRHKQIANSEKKELIKKMLEVKKEYKILEEELSKSAETSIPEDVKIMLNFIKAMNRLGNDRGFNRIIGYDKYKDDLIEKFVFKSILMSKTSQNKKVPNVLLFYGPTGTGKTTFAYALAEQTLSNIRLLDLKDFKEDPQVAMDDIIRLAKEAKENFDKSGDDKTRTIILVNEAGSVLRTNKKVKEEFKEFISDCAEKYKCTLFLTMNEPLKLDKNMLTKEIIPIKVGLPPCDRDTARKILIHGFEKSNKANIDLEPLLDTLYQDKKHIYSNGDITELIKKIIPLEVSNNPESYINCILAKRPTIGPKGMSAFKEAQEYFEKQGQSD